MVGDHSLGGAGGLCRAVWWEAAETVAALVTEPQSARIANPAWVLRSRLVSIWCPGEGHQTFAEKLCQEGGQTQKQDTAGPSRTRRGCRCAPVLTVTCALVEELAHAARPVGM